MKQSIRILEYSGIISLHTEGTKVRTEVFDRYQVNFGVVLASETKNTPINRYKEIVTNLSIKLYSEYGINSPSYENIDELKPVEIDADIKHILESLLQEPIDKLDITPFQCATLKTVGFTALQDILSAKEEELQKAYGIGPKRARKIYNIAFNATIEYISG